MSRIDDPIEFQNIARRLVELRQQHRDLDLAIEGLHAAHADEMAIQRMKKRKLKIKDQIAQLEEALVPDEPA